MSVLIFCNPPWDPVSLINPLNKKEAETGILQEGHVSFFALFPIPVYQASLISPPLPTSCCDVINIR